MKILLITGWGVGTAPLQPLKEKLQQYHHVDLIDIFSLEQPTKILKKAEQADVLIGWSLGGQLAVWLASQVKRPVITLASNPCFVQTSRWQHAMPKAEFLVFKNQYLEHPQQTLKQFYLNVCKGQPSQKANWLHLLKTANPPEKSLLQEGLKLLEHLSLIVCVNELSTDSYHIFAKQDALVPYQVSQNLQNEAVDVYIVENAGHSFPVFCVEETYAQIEKWLVSKI